MSSVSNQFALCLPHTLIEECPLPNDWSNRRNFSNDEHDTGGKTMCGITQREFTAWCEIHKQKTREVITITREEGTSIYLCQYWLPHCDQLAPGLDLCFFDASVNMGPVEAIKLLQRAYQVGDDGHWGMITTAAVASARSDTNSQRYFAGTFTRERMKAYKQMKMFKYFGTDWLRRSDNIHKAAIVMIEGK